MSDRSRPITRAQIRGLRSILASASGLRRSQMRVSVTRIVENGATYVRLVVHHRGRPDVPTYVDVIYARSPHRVLTEVIRGFRRGAYEEACGRSPWTVAS